jgi:methionyl-tRNA synthetase
MTRDNVHEFKKLDPSRVEKGNNYNELETMSLLYCVQCGEMRFEVVMLNSAQNIEDNGIFAICDNCGTINDPRDLLDD